MRQILINEPNLDLRYLYFDVMMLDGETPAFDQQGFQPEINITNTGWDNINIGLLETVGYGRYRALLNDEAVNQLGVILSRYKGANTLEAFGESIEVVQDYRKIDIFESDDSPIFSSYITINEAENFFAQRLHSDAWIDATVVDKNKSLITATQDIENLSFSGWKTNLSQSLEWPRNGSLFIPKQIKVATCEIAIRYLEGYDPQIETETLRIGKEEFFSVRNTYDPTLTEEAKRAGIGSEKAWRLLKPFLRDPRLLKVIRTS